MHTGLVYPNNGCVGAGGSLNAAYGVFENNCIIGSNSHLTQRKVITFRIWFTVFNAVCRNFGKKPGVKTETFLHNINFGRQGTGYKGNWKIFFFTLSQKNFNTRNQVELFNRRVILFNLPFHDGTLGFGKGRELLVDDEPCRPAMESFFEILFRDIEIELRKFFDPERLYQLFTVDDDAVHIENNCSGDCDRKPVLHG